MSIFKISIRAAETIKPMALMRLTQIDDVDELIKTFDRDNIIVEEKFDGFKVQIIKSNKTIHIYTRRGKEKTENFPELIKALSFLPDNTMVEGELVYWENGKQDVGKVTSLAGSSPENSQEKAKELSGEIKIHLYDILWYKGKNISQEPFEQRRKLLQSVVKPSAKIQLTKQYPFSKWQEAMNTAVKSGGEGIVLKIKDKSYQYKSLGEAEPKPKGVMYKYKGGIGKSDSDDYVVYNYETSDKNKLKALFGQYYKGKLYHISEISNFSKEDEEKIKNKLKKGPFVLEIFFQERVPGGLRHQKAGRIRDDKMPKDATMNEFHVKHLDNFKVVEKNDNNDVEIDMNLTKKSIINTEFFLSKRADFADEVIENIESKLDKKPISSKIQDFSGLRAVADPTIDVQKAYQIFSTLESGQNYIVGDSGTSFGSTQVQFGSFVNQLARDPKTQSLTGFTSEQLNELGNSWNTVKKNMGNINIWKQVSVDDEKVRTFVKNNPGYVIRRREGTTIRMNPSSIPGIIKIINGKYVGYELDLAVLRSIGINIDKDLGSLQKITQEYITDGVVKNGIVRLAMANLKPDLYNKFYNTFSVKSVKTNQQLRNLADRATQHDFMNRINQVLEAVKQYGYDTTAPGAYNIYQLLGIANSSGVGRVQQFLKTRKPFDPANLHYLQRANKMISKITGLPSEFSSNGGLSGFKTAAVDFAISKRAIELESELESEPELENEFEDEPTKTEIDRTIFKIYNIFFNKMRELLHITEFYTAIINKIGFTPDSNMHLIKIIDDSVINYLLENKEIILENPNVNFFTDFLIKKWDLNLIESYNKFSISKRAEYTEPGVLYFPGSYANGIKEGKRRMTIRAGDVPVEVSEVVKCVSYAGAHICDLFITSKEWMSLNRIEKAFGERVAKSLEQKFGKDRRFVVVRFDVYENVNSADDDIPEISFPEDEYKFLEKRLRSGKGIYTTRISKERRKYKEGQEYMTPWGHKIKVVNIVSLKGVENHPFIDELTTEQKEQIGNHKYDLIRFEKVVYEKADDKDDNKWEEVLIDKDGVKLTRQQIKNHYIKSDIKKKIMARIKDNPIIVYIGTGTNEKILKRNHNNKPIVITNDDPEKSESPNNYFYWVERRLLSIHQVFGTKTDLGFVDLDIHGDFPLADAKKYAKEVSTKIKDKFDALAIVYQSGGTGLHIEFNLKKEENINTLRDDLKDMLDEINKDWDGVTTSIVKGKGMRSDISTLHNKGSIRVPGSLGEIYGKVKKPLGSDQDGDDDTFGNTNFGNKYSDAPENLDEEPGSLDTGAIISKPDMGAFPETDVGNYTFALFKRNKLVKQSIYKDPNLQKEYIWFWDPKKEKLFYKLIFEKGKDIPVIDHYTFAEMVDSNVIFISKNFRGYVYFFTGKNKGEIHLYSGDPKEMPSKLYNALKELIRGDEQIKQIDIPFGFKSELWKANEKSRQLSEHMEKRKWMGYDYPDPDFIERLNLKFASLKLTTYEQKKIQNIWKLAGLIEDDEEEFEKMLKKYQKGEFDEDEDNEDEATKWLTEHDPEASIIEPKKKVDLSPRTKMPRKTIYDQLEGEIPEVLHSKKVEKNKPKRHRKTKEYEEESDIDSAVPYEDLFGALMGEQKKTEEKVEKLSLKELVSLISPIINSEKFENIRAKINKQLDDEGQQFHSSVSSLTSEELLEYLIQENEYADVDKTLREEYISNLIKQDKDLAQMPQDLVKEEIQKKLDVPINKNQLKQEIETGRTLTDQGEQFAIDDLLRMSEKDRKAAKPNFTERLLPPSDEKGNISTNWPKIEIPSFSEESIMYFHPDNLNDGPSLRKTFSDPRAWDVLKKQPWLLQKWILPSLIMSIGYRWFELNSTKEYVGKRVDRGNALTFKHLQGGAPFSMLDDVMSEESIKKLESGEISISDLPESKEYVQHINRLVTELTNSYFAKENPLISIDEYLYKGLQNEMIKIIAKKHGFIRKHIPKCSICLSEADERTEIEPMTIVDKGLYKCPNCEKIVNRLKGDLPDLQNELQLINKKLTNYTEAKERLVSGEITKIIKEKFEIVIKDTEPHLERFNMRKLILEKQISDINKHISLRSSQSKVPYFHTLCPNPTCKLQRIPLTAVDWEDPVWKTPEGETLRVNLKKQYQIEMPAIEQNADEFKLDVPVPSHISKTLIPSSKLSWIYFVPFKCPHDGVRFKMKDVIGQGFRGMAGFFYYPHEKYMWQSNEDKNKKMLEKDPQLDPTNKAPELGDLKTISGRAQKAAQIQYYDFYAYLRMLDVALKTGKKEFEINGKTYETKPLNKKQKTSYARELLLYSTIADFSSSDIESYLNWLAGSSLSSKPIYENGIVQNKNTIERVLSYTDKREQIYLPILQKWIDNMMQVSDFMERFDLSGWLVNTGKLQEDGSYSEDGIPSDGPGTYFIAQVKNATTEDSNFYGFECQLESKRKKDDKYKKHFDKRGPRLLRVLDVRRVKEQDIKHLTSQQKSGKDAVPKTIAENILKKTKDNLLPEIKNHGFHEISLNDNRTTLVPGDFVLVRAFIMPGKFYGAPIISIQDVEENKRDFEFWQKFNELIRLKQNEPEYWEKFETKLSQTKPYLYRLEDIIDREIFKAKSKKKADFVLSVREAKDPLSIYKSKREFEETPEPEGEISKKNKHRFVIQDHLSKHHHWDLRLENDDGTMSSWALPKFRLPNEKEKLLAISVENHPISYNKFEGKIPEGQYGSGTVKIHDGGTYKKIEWTEKKISFKLNGKKETGSYNIIKTSGNKWLIMRAKNED
ncbi:MAG: DNA polymerase ligase N-terminal domain-containing protein [Patescibacteria group bacterium]|jgi:bifunctional non-homologous end joining protein LigD